MLESNQPLPGISEPCRHGHRPPSSGGRDRTCVSRVTVARRAARPHRNEWSGRRGSRTPKAVKPTRFRDGIPRRWQSFHDDGPGRSRTCTAPSKSRQLSPVELRSPNEGDVAGRIRTCGASRFRRPLYRSELRPRGATETAGLEPASGARRRRASNTLPFQLGHASVSVRTSRRGWTRTSSLLFVRQALSAIELLADELRDKDSNLDRDGQSVVSFRLDDPGTVLRPPRDAKSTQRPPGPASVTFVRSRTMFFKPLAYPSTLDRRKSASYVEELWSPALLRFPEICRQKPQLIQRHILLRGSAEEPFSLRRGLEFDLALVQAEHHTLVFVFDFAPIRRRRPSRVALARIGMRLGNLACTPPGEG
jgi:hypothetical protein